MGERRRGYVIAAPRDESDFVRLSRKCPTKGEASSFLRAIPGEVMLVSCPRGNAPPSLNEGPSFYLDGEANRATALRIEHGDVAHRARVEQEESEPSSAFVGEILDANRGLERATADA